MNKVLSILLSSDGKEGFFNKQVISLSKQIKDNGLKEKVEFLTCRDNAVTVGERNNRLLEAATGGWVMFIKETDVLSDWALKNIVQNLGSQNPDVVSLMGMLMKEGAPPKMFVHSIKNQAVTDSGMIMMMPPCYRNPLRASIAKKCRFDNLNEQEDVGFNNALLKTGAIKTEFSIDKSYLMVKA